MNKAIRDLARFGLAVHWLRPKSKAPISSDWQNKPIYSAEALEKSYLKGNNVGVRLGEPSETDNGFIHVLDLDIRDPAHAKECWKTLKSLFPHTNFNDFPTVISGSGGESRHIYFSSPEPYKSKKLAHSEKNFTDDKGIKHWFWEIELFGTGKQVVLPPSIHPDTGLEYVWEREIDISEGIPTLDEDRLENLAADKHEEITKDQTGVSYEEAEAYLEDLDLGVWCEDRAGWIKVGMALHHEFGGAKDAFLVWSEFSQQSKKFNLTVLKQQWRSFREVKQRTVTFRSIIEAANQARHASFRENIADEFEDIEPEPEEKPEPKINVKDYPIYHEDPIENKAIIKGLAGIPKHLLTVPGILGEVVDYYNQSAIKAQPMFAVQAALALGSVIGSRNHKTDRENYTSAYFFNVVSSSSGKEHIDTVISDMLLGAGLDNLLGAGDYTSDEALVGELVNGGPRKLAVIDEGSQFIAAMRSHNGPKYTLLRQLLSLYGKQGKTAMLKRFSASGKSQAEIDTMNGRKIVKPAFSMVLLCPPGPLAETLEPADLESGFLNRMLMCISTVSLGRSRQNRKVPQISRNIKDWMQSVSRATGSEDEADEFRLIDEAGVAPEPIIYDFDRKCYDILDDFEMKVISEQRKLPENMQVIFGRTLEKAMKLALVICLSCKSKTVKAEHLNWAIDYVFYLDSTMAEWIFQNLGTTQLTKVSAEIAKTIQANPEGIKYPRLIQSCAAYRNLPSERERAEAMARAKSDFGVYELIPERKRGSPPPTVRLFVK